MLFIALFYLWHKALCVAHLTFVLALSLAFYSLLPPHLQHQHCLQNLGLLKPPPLPPEAEPRLPQPTPKLQLPVFHHCPWCCFWSCFQNHFLALTVLSRSQKGPCSAFLLYITGDRKWFGLNRDGSFGKQRVFVVEKNIRGIHFQPWAHNQQPQ